MDEVPPDRTSGFDGIVRIARGALDFLFA